jgi:hypothetical protein
VLNGENEHSNFLRKIPEEIEGGWTFQVKKKTKKRVDTIPREQPISSPFHTNKHSPRREKRL